MLDTDAYKFIIYIKSRYMLTLNKYLKESLLDDDEDIMAVGDDSVIEHSIEQFINDNYDVSGTYKITYDKYDESDSDFVVIVNGDISLKKTSKIEEVTNGFFEFLSVSGSFLIKDKNNIKNLKGMPYSVGRDVCIYSSKIETLDGISQHIGAKNKYDISKNDYLKSLKGMPEKVDGDINIRDCKKLNNLIYGPNHINGHFFCFRCDLTSLEGAPKYVGKSFICSDNKNLKSLKGLPKVIGWDLDYSGCPIKDESDIKNSVIKGNIIWKN